MLYTLGIKAYAAAVGIAARRNHKARLLVDGHRHAMEKLRRDIAAAGPGRWVWIHAASLGEFEQGRPLIERLRRERPDLKVLLTFFSPSGYEVRKNYPGADAVSYLPFDIPERVSEFLDTVRPSTAIFVKYEFWSNYLHELRRRDIPTYIISAIFRPKQIFFRPWGGTFRKLLRCFTHLYVQDERSRTLLAGIGVDNVTVAGDTRFDRVTDILLTATDMPALDAFAASTPQVLVAGSTWPADEAALVPWLLSRSDVKGIIAPHEFDRARLAELQRQLGPGTRLLSELEGAPAAEAAGASHIIVDSFGKLASIYRKATLAYVGGGFGAGIHNINEAAVYGVPVIFGPNHHKFKEATDLIACGGGFCADSCIALARIASQLADNPDLREHAAAEAAAYIRRSIGATDKIFTDLFARRR